MSQMVTAKASAKPSTATRQNETPAESFDIQTHYRAVLNEIGMSPEDTGGKTTFLGEIRFSKAYTASAPASASRSWQPRPVRRPSGGCARAAART